jgi:hypothetical protein
MLVNRELLCTCVLSEQLPTRPVDWKEEQCYDVEENIYIIYIQIIRTVIYWKQQTLVQEVISCNSEK